MVSHSVRSREPNARGFSRIHRKKGVLYLICIFFRNYL